MNASSHPANSSLTLIEGAIFDDEYAELAEVIDSDPVEIKISPEERQLLPPQFLQLAKRLHQNYLYWKHLRDRQQTTQLTFYLYTQVEITKAAEKVAEAGTPIAPDILLLLETKIALATINSLLLAAEEYLNASCLQDAKESVDTALSALYEFLKTREQLEPSLEAAVASIRRDIANEPETRQYASYLATQIARLQDSSLVQEPKFYVVRNQLEKLRETLVLLIPSDRNIPSQRVGSQQKLDALISRLLFAMVEEEAYITTIGSVKVHSRGWNTAIFSADGAYLAATSNDCIARLVEVKTGRDVKTVQHESAIEEIAFSPDGAYLATRSRDTVKLAKVLAGKELTLTQQGVKFAPEKDWTIAHRGVGELLFSANGAYLATRALNGVKLVKVSTGREITAIESVDSIGFSPKGTYLVARSRDRVQLIKVDTGVEVRAIEHLQRPSFSPKGGYLAIKALNAARNDVVFSPNGSYLAATSKDNIVALVKIASGAAVTTIQHQSAINDLAFSPDSAYLATASKDNIVKIAAVQTGREMWTLKDSPPVEWVSFSPNSAYLMARADRRVKVVEVATGTTVATLREGSDIGEVVFSPSGTHLVLRMSARGKLVEVATGKELTALDFGISAVNFIFSPDGNYLVVNAPKTDKWIEVATGREVGTIPSGSRTIRFSPDSTYLAIAAVESAILVETATYRKIAKIAYSDESFASQSIPVFSADGTYLALGTSRTVKLVEVATGKEIAAITHGDAVVSVSFSPDSRYLATASRNGIARLADLNKLFQLVGEAEARSATPPPPQIAAIACMEKPESFFLAWLRVQSNRHSFYEYMLDRAKQEREGLAVRYRTPILETSLLLESVGFLLLNAEKHYQRVYPTLSGVGDSEIALIAMQEMKQSISAALSSLYEFLYQRMALDEEDYSEVIERFRQEVEETVDNSDTTLKMYQKIQFLLQFAGIQTKSELQTTKEMLEGMEGIFKKIVPAQAIAKDRETPAIPLKKYVGKQYIIDAIENYEVENVDLVALLSQLNTFGILNQATASAAIEKIPPQRVIEFCKLLPKEFLTEVVEAAAVRRTTSQDIVELCELLPQDSFNREIVFRAMNKRKRFHEVAIASLFTDISQKKILLKMLKSDSRKK